MKVEWVGMDLALLEGDGLVFLVVAVFAHEGLEGGSEVLLEGFEGEENLNHAFALIGYFTSLIHKEDTALACIHVGRKACGLVKGHTFIVGKRLNFIIHKCEQGVFGV